MQIRYTVYSQTQHVIANNAQILTKIVPSHKQEDAQTGGPEKAPHLLSSVPNVANCGFTASEMSLLLE